MIVKSGRGKGQWLKAEVKDGKLLISIGVDVLQFAAQMHLDAEAVELSEGREKNADVVICDAAGFAGEVARELLRESESGEHMLGALLDRAALAVTHAGSLYLVDRTEGN